MRTLVIGNIGSDAGYWIIDGSGHIRHVGGWNPEAFTDVVAGMQVIKAATQFKAPGVAESVVASVHELVQKHLSEHLDGAETVVVIAS